MHIIDDFNPATPQQAAIGCRLFLLKRLLVKSDEEFCLELALHPPLLRNLEEGIIPISSELCQKLSEVYGVRVSWLLEGKDLMFYKKNPATRFICLAIDFLLHYEDPLFIPVINMLWNPHMSEDEINKVLTNMFVNEELVMKEKRAIKKENHILSHL